MAENLARVMRTLTASAETARLRGHAELIPLLKLTLSRDQFGDTPTSLVLWLSTRPVTVTGAGEVWPLLESVGPLSEQSAELTPQATPGTMDVTVANDVPLDVHGVEGFTDMFRKGAQLAGYDAAMATADYYELDAHALDLAHARAYGPFVVDQVQPVDLTRATVRLITRDAILDVRREALTPVLVEAVPARITLKVNGTAVLTYDDLVGKPNGYAGLTVAGGPEIPWSGGAASGRSGGGLTQFICGPVNETGAQFGSALWTPPGTPTIVGTECQSTGLIQHVNTFGEREASIRFTFGPKPTPFGLGDLEAVATVDVRGHYRGLVARFSQLSYLEGSNEIEIHPARSFVSLPAPGLSFDFGSTGLTSGSLITLTWQPLSEL